MHESWIVKDRGLRSIIPDAWSIGTRRVRRAFFNLALNTLHYSCHNEAESPKNPRVMHCEATTAKLANYPVQLIIHVAVHTQWTATPILTSPYPFTLSDRVFAFCRTSFKPRPLDNLRLIHLQFGQNSPQKKTPVAHTSSAKDENAETGTGMRVYGRRRRFQ